MRGDPFLLRPPMVHLVVLIAPLLYCGSIVAFSVNVPVGDDYAVLGFINSFHAANELPEKTRLLFGLHNEHRPVTLRAISLLWEQAFGSLNFRALGLIGNTALLLALLQIGRILDFRRDPLKWALLLLLVLQPQTEKLMFYPMAVVQAYVGLLLAILYFRFSLGESRIALAIAAYLLTVATTGAYAFLVFVTAPLLLFQRRLKDAAVYLAVAAGVMIWYFGDFTNDQGSRLVYLVQNPTRVAFLFFSLLGNIVQAPFGEWGASYLPSLVGLLLFTYCGLCARVLLSAPEASSSRASIAVMSLLLFCLLMSTLVAFGRARMYEDVLLTAAFDGRYRIYGLLLFALFCVSALDRLRRRGLLTREIQVAALSLALLFNLTWFAARIGSMAEDARRRVEGMRIYLNERDSSVLMTWAVPRGYAASELRVAMETGVYRP